MKFKNRNVIINQYSADGQKQRSDFYTRLTTITPVSEGDIVNPEKNYSDAVYAYTGTVYIGAFEYIISKTKSYVGGGVYLYTDVFTANKIYTPEGYIDYLNGSFVSTGVRYNYYRKDHLGNIREVWNGVRKNYSGTVMEAAGTRQVTQYYPSGLPWAEGTGATVQKHKYNDKEFIEMHGLDEYDSEARWYYPAIMRTTTLDPLAEKYYSISPYAWCGNNPIRLVDPDGREVTLRGYDTNAFIQAIQDRVGTSITIKLEDNGYLSYSINDKDNISDKAQIVMNSIDNKDIQLDLISVKGSKTPDGTPMEGGAFLGNTVLKDENGNATKVIAEQAMNVDFLNKLDNASNDPKLNGLIHEISEAYIGAKNSLKSGNNAPKATLSEKNNPNSAYSIAHNAAYPQPVIYTFSSLPNEYYTLQWSPLKITVSPNSPLSGWYRDGRKLVKFYTK